MIGIVFWIINIFRDIWYDDISYLSYTFSKATILPPSDLRKEFDTPPYSQQIEIGSQAELRCHPPKGNPEPRVSYWLKNGQKIDDPNLIQSATGSLLILQARLSDMANYTCVATNDAIERQSQPALVTVFGKIIWKSFSFCYFVLSFLCSIFLSPFPSFVTSSFLPFPPLLLLPSPFPSFVPSSFLPFSLSPFLPFSLSLTLRSSSLRLLNYGL